MDTDTGSRFKNGKLAHKARSVPLPSVQGPDSAVSLNPDSRGWIRIPDQDLILKGKLAHKARCQLHSRVYRVRIQLGH